MANTDIPLLCEACSTCPVHQRNVELQRRLAEAQGNATAAAGIAAEALETAARKARRRTGGGGIE